MSIIYKRAVLSLVVLAIAVGLNTDKVYEKYKTEAFNFALWGDMPYAKNGDGSKIQALIDDINASNVEFSVFDGDIKDGRSPCNDWQYTDAADRFNRFEKPMVYVPGDNEWSDCHRTNNGGYNNLERLNHLRQIMFNSPDSFGQKKMKLEHQGELGGENTENVRWTHGSVVFVGLNMPGSNNNKVNADDCISAKSTRTQADCDTDNIEYNIRDAANIKFVKESFQKTKTGQRQGHSSQDSGRPQL
jgi:predicted DNA-binding protein